MLGVTVRDLAPAGFLAVDVRGFLELLGDSSRWLISEVEATGERCMELEGLADGRTQAPGLRLRELANSVTQVIDDEFAAYHSDDPEPWAIIRAIDSSWFEFDCQDTTLLREARARIRDVTDCDEPA